jgi:hypothetical protein
MQTCSQKLRNSTSNILLVLFATVWFAGGLYYLLSLPKKPVVVYDCTLTDQSDFPVEVREACRKRVESGRV